LHQITTRRQDTRRRIYCFSSQICIKSQLRGGCRCRDRTVSHLKFASNHNHGLIGAGNQKLFLISNLHQITTTRGYKLFCSNCFSSQICIKSQQANCNDKSCPTVSHLKFASNHNTPSIPRHGSPTVSHLKFASNHNRLTVQQSSLLTVSHLKFASNHNDCFCFRCSVLTVSHLKFASNHNQSSSLRVWS